MEMVRFLISLPEPTRDDLKKAANARGQTLNALIRQIIWEWMERKC